MRVNPSEELVATMRVTRMAVGAVLLGAVAGCSLIGRQLFKQPSVELRDVRLAGVGVAGGNLDVVLAVYNPNGYRLDATQMHYQVTVDSVPVADGELSDRLRFDGGDTTIVHVPVKFTFAGLSLAGRQLAQTGAVTYHVTGDLTVDSPIGSRTFPFRASGRFTTINATIH
jgi:LEA14-like dessication related protein